MSALAMDAKQSAQRSTCKPLSGKEPVPPDPFGSEQSLARVGERISFAGTTFPGHLWTAWLTPLRGHGPYSTPRGGPSCWL